MSATREVGIIIINNINYTYHMMLDIAQWMVPGRADTVGSLEGRLG